MKDKGVNILGILIAVVCAIVAVIVALLLIGRNSGNKQNSGINKEDLQSGAELVKAITMTDVEYYAKAYELQVVDNGDTSFSVDTLVCYDLPLQVQYFPSHDGVSAEFSRADVYYIPFNDEYKKMEQPQFTHNGADLKVEVEKLFRMIDNAFGVEVNGKYFIISNDGTLLDNKSDAAYDALIANTAFLDFTLRDENGYYWMLSCDRSEEGIIFFKFTNHFSAEIYAENIAHVTVEQPPVEQQTNLLPTA